MLDIRCRMPDVQMAICRKPKIGRNRRAGVIPLSGEMSRSDKRVRDRRICSRRMKNRFYLSPFRLAAASPSSEGETHNRSQYKPFPPLMREVARALRVTEGEDRRAGLAPAVGNGSTKPFLVYPKNFCPCSPGRTKSVYLRREQAPPYKFKQIFHCFAVERLCKHAVPTNLPIPASVLCFLNSELCFPAIS